jgi:polyisoprenoid-binding protein YceI
MKIPVILILASCLLPAADTYQIDSAHSSAQFAVRHMLVATVRGTIGKITGSVVYDAANPAASSVQATLDVSTIDTRELKRDAHLKSADFFDVGKYPTMTFQSKKVVPAGAGKLKVTGDLTMHGVTRPVTWDVDGPTPPVEAGAGGKGAGTWKSGLSASARISRKEFGITWNRLMDTGGAVVGDEVNVTVDLELNRR